MKIGMIVKITNSSSAFYGKIGELVKFNDEHEIAIVVIDGVNHTFLYNEFIRVIREIKVGDRVRIVDPGTNFNGWEGVVTEAYPEVDSYNVSLTVTGWDRKDLEVL